MNNMSGMVFEVRVKQDGTVVTEVIDRGDQICSNIKRITNAVGAELSDEHIGPECDDVKEIQT